MCGSSKKKFSQTLIINGTGLARRKSRRTSRRGWELNQSQTEDTDGYCNDSLYGKG